MVVQPDHERRVVRNKGSYQQVQHDATKRPARPRRAVEHAMIVLELRLGAQAHHAQRCRHGALARSQDRANQQDVGPRPDPFAKGGFKVPQYLYNWWRQVPHCLPFLGRLGKLSVPCPLRFV